MEQVGSLWSWRRGDPLPMLEAPAASWRGRAFHPNDTDLCDFAAIAQVFDLSSQRSHERFALGHHAYNGFIGEHPVACGWVAHGSATFGEPPVAFQTPPDTVYLYDFVTLPAWRGLGCYPALLRAIITAEPARDFWIMHHISNTASQRGIAHAGFQLAATVHRTAPGALALLPADDIERAEAGASMLALPLLPTR